MAERTDCIVAAAPLRAFIGEIGFLLGSSSPEVEKVQQVKDRLMRLLEAPAWLPDLCRVGDDEGYARHLLYRQEGGGFCLVVMVWGPGQKTAIHDHAGVWCVEGVYEGLIEVKRYDLQEEEGDRVRFAAGELIRAGVGACGALIPPVEYHQITNATDATAISLHVYGRDLEICHVFQPLGGDLYQKEPKRMQYRNILSLSLGEDDP